MTSVAIPAFGFETAGRMIFGRGTAARAADEITAFGHRILLVHGASARRATWLRDDLTDLGCEVTLVSCPREPNLDMVQSAAAIARKLEAQVVVGLGGGSAIDLAKAVAALAAATGDAMDYLEVVGRGQVLDRHPRPFVAIPTTSGTGAEVTKNAVIGVPAHRRKVSLRDSRMLADLALIDPALTDGSPRKVTLASGLDAITQVIEPFLCTRANPVTDALCLQAIPKGLTAMARLMVEEDPAARDEMAIVSVFGGMALANSGLGAVHGLAGVIGGLTEAAHGAICGALLPHVLAANAAGRSEATARIAHVEEVICASLDLSAIADFSEWIRAQGLPGLQELGVDPADHRAIAEAAHHSSSMTANPRKLSTEDLCAILRAAG